MFQCLIFVLCHSNQLFKLKPAIAIIISETKEVPEAYLEPFQTSMNNYFAETVLTAKS